MDEGALGRVRRRRSETWCVFFFWFGVNVLFIRDIEMLIFGTGARMALVPSSVRGYMKELGIQMDVMDTVGAFLILLVRPGSFCFRRTHVRRIICWWKRVDAWLLHYSPSSPKSGQGNKGGNDGLCSYASCTLSHCFTNTSSLSFWSCLPLAFVDWHRRFLWWGPTSIFIFVIQERWLGNLDRQ